MVLKFAIITVRRFLSLFVVLMVYLYKLVKPVKPEPSRKLYIVTNILIVPIVAGLVIGEHVEASMNLQDLYQIVMQHDISKDPSGNSSEHSIQHIQDLGKKPLDEKTSLMRNN